MTFNAVDKMGRGSAQLAQSSESTGECMAACYDMLAIEQNPHHWGSLSFWTVCLYHSNIAEEIQSNEM